MGTTRIKTSELKEKTLTWAVATVENLNPRIVTLGTGAIDIAYDGNKMMPFDHWSQGGPIIERKGICSEFSTGIGWYAYFKNANGEALNTQHGPAPLIAAMRCYVASKLGDEINVPNELL